MSHCTYNLYIHIIGRSRKVSRKIEKEELCIKFMYVLGGICVQFVVSFVRALCAPPGATFFASLVASNAPSDGSFDLAPFSLLLSFLKVINIEGRSHYDAMYDSRRITRTMWRLRGRTEAFSNAANGNERFHRLLLYQSSQRNQRRQNGRKYGGPLQIA